MKRGIWLSLLLLVPSGLLLVDVVDGLPRNRRARNNNYSNNYYNNNAMSGFVQVAPKILNQATGYTPLYLAYSYEDANTEAMAFQDKVRVFLKVWDQDTVSVDEPIVAEVHVTDLSKSQESHTIYVPVKFQEQQDGVPLAVFDVTNTDEMKELIRPAKVYRFFVNLHRQADQYGDDSVVGRVPHAYYVATSGESQLDLARQQIAMRTFREFYYAEQGWASTEPYWMDCVAYYRWATGFCTVGSYDGHASLDYLFGGVAPMHIGGNIPALAAEGSILGDYVRVPGHSFMLLAYDPELQQVWTMEGNYNSTIEVTVRYANTDWSVGHLIDEHIREDVFVSRRAAEPASDEVDTTDQIVVDSPQNPSDSPTDATPDATPDAATPDPTTVASPEAPTVQVPDAVVVAADDAPAMVTSDRPQVLMNYQSNDNSDNGRRRLFRLFRRRR